MTCSPLLPTAAVLLLPFLFTGQQPTQPAVKTNPMPVAARFEPAGGMEQIISLANAFKKTLSAGQLAVVQRPYSKAEAVLWSNLPEFADRPRRIGLRIGSLNDTQLKAARALMAAAMTRNVPNEGFNELEGNLAADDYLGHRSGNTETFNDGNYFLAFLGMPGPSGLWELQFGGHHFAFANTYNGSKLAGFTPSFRGIEPMVPINRNGQTYQPMAQEQQAFADLLTSLNTGQQATAKLPATFRDILLGPDRDGQFPATKQGLKGRDLSAAQKKLVLNAIERYVDDLDSATVAPVLAQYTADLDNTYVAYSGSGTLNQTGDYVRIDGPRVWIEYSAQPSRDIPGTVHPHSVWRDHLTDYGGN